MESADLLRFSSGRIIETSVESFAVPFAAQKRVARQTPLATIAHARGELGSAKPAM